MRFNDSFFFLILLGIGSQDLERLERLCGDDSFLDDIVQRNDLQGSSYCLPQSANMPILQLLLRELLHSGVVYCLLNTSVTHQRDRTGLIALCTLKRDDNFQAYMALKGLDSGVRS